MITIERDTILQAMGQARLHLERADQAARVCIEADQEAKDHDREWAQDLFTHESEQQGQAVITEQNKAIDAITRLIADAGHDIMIMGAHE